MKGHIKKDGVLLMSRSYRRECNAPVSAIFLAKEGDRREDLEALNTNYIITTGIWKKIAQETRQFIYIHLKPSFMWQQQTTLASPLQNNKVLSFRSTDDIPAPNIHTLGIYTTIFNLPYNSYISVMLITGCCIHEWLTLFKIPISFQSH